MRKSVVGYEGMYEVCDGGMVYSMDRPDARGHKIKGRTLKDFHGHHKYNAVALSKNGKLKTFAVHRIVLEAFVGPRPKGYEARHKDGNKRNNTLSNLEWATHITNEADKLTHGTRMIGSMHTNSKLTESKVLEIVETVASTPKSPTGRIRRHTCTRIADRMGVSVGTIYSVLDGSSWGMFTGIPYRYNIHSECRKMRRLKSRIIPKPITHEPST